MMYSSCLLSTSYQHVVQPYHLHTNDWVTILVILCFFVTTYVLASGGAMLLKHGRDFLLVRQQERSFELQSSGYFRSRLLLILQTVLLLSLLCLDSFSLAKLTNSFQSPLGLLGVYIVSWSLFLLFKWLLYSLVGWIFFNAYTRRQWIDSYLFIIAVFGLLCFPVVLCAIYLHIPSFPTLLCTIFISFLCEILLFYKSFCIFSPSSYGYFYLFVYFCTLEIIPLLLMGKGMVLINGF